MLEACWHPWALLPALMLMLMLMLMLVLMPMLVLVLVLILISSGVQARHHLSLEGLDLCRHLHKPHPALGRGQGAGEHPREEGSRGGRGGQGSRVLRVALS